MEKEHFEILLEDINSKLDLVTEGYAALNRKIDSNQKKDEENQHALYMMIKESNAGLNKKIDNAQQNLSKEIQDLRKENEAAHEKMCKENEAAHKDMRKDTQDLRKENEAAHKEMRKETQDLRKENEAAHKEILGGIKLSYRELDSRMKFLEQEVSTLSQRVSRLEAARV